MNVPVGERVCAVLNAECAGAIENRNRKNESAQRRPAGRGEQKECSRVEVEDTLHIWLLCQWKGKRDKSAGAGRRSFRRRNPASSTFLLPLTKLKLSTVTCK